MPHAVLTGATKMPPLIDRPLLQEETVIYRVVEVARSLKGWLLKCVIIHPSQGAPRKFLARVDERDDGLVAHLDDHMHVERDDDVFRFLALIAEALLRANPEARVAQTNLAKWLSTPTAP